MKHRLYRWLLALLPCSQAFYAASQPGLQTGFNRSEYADVLWLGFYGIGDSLASQSSFDLEQGRYQRLFRSRDVGLYNRCEIYLRQDSVAVLHFRGTINKMESWLENFYAAMVPASGEIGLTKETRFQYSLASDPRAAVHAGWLIGLGFLSQEFNPPVEKLLARGIRQFIVAGHSQGGALSFLATSYLYHRYSQQYPDLRLKTYASAAPKPGNLYYAYDFDHITLGGLGFRVVNSEDWVPETAFSVQTLGDFNEVNPFSQAQTVIKKQKIGARVAMNHVYRKLRKGSEKAQKRFTHYLGDKLFPMIRKTLPELEEPPYANTNNYATAGSPVVLMADKDYLAAFPQDARKVFIHHLYQPYRFLLDQQFPKLPSEGK